MSGHEIKEEILFLNTPISKNVQDIIGVETHVKKVNYAIDSGAQMIAITAPFGSGKTSIIELLEKERERNPWNDSNIETDIADKSKTDEGVFQDKKDRKKKEKEIKKQKKDWEKKRSREKIYKISMWSQLFEQENKGATNDLHRTFIYQLASQINHKRGTYIRRRLNPNYGVLKLHVNKKRYWVVFVLAVIAFSLCWGLNAFSEDLNNIFPLLKDWETTLKTFLLLLGTILAIIAIAASEIIFSSIKGRSEKRNVESTEIIDIYRDEILKYAWKIGPFHSGNKKYIVVIEDLDRTSDAKSVICFLKELRKYYIPKEEGKESVYQNQIVFIVNLKPEALLLKDNESENYANESLYAKLFDYVLNLQTINIDNYDAILEGLLLEKEDLINKLDIKKRKKLSEIPGMKWIIREKRIGIREIKERLNIAFSIYESLKDKFPEKPIAFETCAVVAYLTTAFEKDFYQTEDRTFKELVELSMQGKLTEVKCKEIMPQASDDYLSVVIELIEARLIDSTYRTYFYNYPKGSYLYSSEEMQVMNAILYADKIDRLEQAAQKVEEMGGKIIQRAFETLEQLKLPLSDTIFESETLYVNALRYVREKVFQYIDNLDYSEDADAKNIKFFSKILSYDQQRKRYNKRVAEKICEIWERHFSEKALIQLRIMLCKEFSKEIMWYESLFMGVHALLREEEMKALSLLDCIDLINYEHADFNVSIPTYLQQRLTSQNSINADELAKMEDMISTSGVFLTEKEMASLYLDYMVAAGKIVPEFEQVIRKLVLGETISEEEKKQLINKYQLIVNKKADVLSNESLDFISELIPCEGFSLEVGEKLLEEGYYLDYVLVLLLIGEKIPFESDEIQKIEKSQEWLSANLEYFSRIREQLCECNEELLVKYEFMFTEKYPALSEKELDLLQRNNENCEDLVMKLLPCELIMEDNYGTYVSFFNRKKQTNNVTYAILVYVSGVLPEVAKKMFYALDYDKIRYRHISSERKLNVKRLFTDILELDTPEEKLQFMKVTKHIDSVWEAGLLETLKEDEQLREVYIEIVNSSELVSKGTINTLCKLGHIYPMSPIVNKLFYENKKYVEFIVSETTGKKCFVMATGDLRAELWTSYLKIFSGGGYINTRKYMTANLDFVRAVMREKAYFGLKEENRMQLTGVEQDSECINNVMEYGDDFALEYFIKMAGFKDRDAAKTFVEIVQKNDILLASDELYEYIHEKLIDGPLKAKYTNARKKKGYL